MGRQLYRGARPVWAAFLASLAFTVIFCILSALSERELQRGRFHATPPGFNEAAWRSLLAGATISTAFTFTLAIGFSALAFSLLLCASKPLAHPSRTFGRGFMVAASWWTALHLVQVTLHLTSLQPAVRFWQLQTGAKVNMALLAACTWFGVVSSFCYVMFGILLLTWHHEPLDELPATMQLSVAAAPEGVTV